MEGVIRIRNRQVTISLTENNQIVDKIIFEDEHNLSSVLLLHIDELLAKNKKKPKDIKNFSVDSDQGDSFTTTRIAKSVANAFSWGVKAYSI